MGAAYVPETTIHEPEPGLEETSFYDRKPNLPAGTHICEIEMILIPVKLKLSLHKLMVLE